MFEADFRITALVRSDGQGQRVFRITERESPVNDTECLSRLMRLTSRLLLQFFILAN
jgi:hypothetical protein